MRPSKRIRNMHHPDCTFVSDESAGCECGANKVADEVATLETKLSKMEENYHELLFAVVNKHEGETRHETALRYITEHENRPAKETLAGGEEA